jgi:hypothetical protein
MEVGAQKLVAALLPDQKYSANWKLIHDSINQNRKP